MPVRSRISAGGDRRVGVIFFVRPRSLLESELPMIDTVTTSAKPISATAVLRPAVLAILLGALLVYGVGFASPMAIHNAAHDARHAFAFPCH
jgi:cobalt transporter subunit CbtB